MADFIRIDPLTGFIDVVQRVPGEIIPPPIEGREHIRVSAQVAQDIFSQLDQDYFFLKATSSITTVPIIVVTTSVSVDLI